MNNDINISGFLNGFDSLIQIIYNQKEPLKTKIIPTNDKVFIGYGIIFKSVQNILKDSLENLRMKIDHGINFYLPPESYGTQDLRIKDAIKYAEIIKKYHPKQKPKTSHIIEPDKIIVKRSEISWYLNLDNFLSKCDKRTEIIKKFQKDVKNSRT